MLTTTTDTDRGRHHTAKSIAITKDQDTGKVSTSPGELHEDT